MSLGPMIPNKGHWCDYCQTYHTSMSCYHPGARRIAKLEAELAKRDSAIEVLHSEWQGAEERATFQKERSEQAEAALAERDRMLDFAALDFIHDGELSPNGVAGCERCQGYLADLKARAEEGREEPPSCPACDGDGRIPDKTGGGHHGTCKTCGGTGTQ